MAVTITENEKIHYAHDPDNCFLQLFTIQLTETAPALAERMSADGLSVQFQPTGTFNILSDGQPMTTYALMHYFHDRCADIIERDPFFDADPQDNILRVKRAVAVAAKVPLCYN